MNRASVRERWYRTLERVPVAYCAWQRRFADRHVVDRRTDLLVEGCAGAANSFTRESIRIANPGIRIASHSHAIAHVKRALALDVPVLVLLRAPVASLVSVLARFPDAGYTVETELARYQRFYEGALAVSDRVAMAPFEETTRHLDDVLRVVNGRFGTAFATLEDVDPALRRAVDESLAAWTNHVFGADSEFRAPSPTAARSQLAATIRTQLDESRYVRDRARCEELHDQLVAVAMAPFARLGGSPPRAVDAESAVEDPAVRYRSSRAASRRSGRSRDSRGLER
jgi:hypothetical protein